LWSAKPSIEIDSATRTMNSPDPTNPEEFHITASTDDARCTTLGIVGPLDLITEEAFEMELDRAVAGDPAELVVDLTAAPFVSVRGYALIGLAGEDVDRLVIRTASALSARVLDALGFDRVTCSEVSTRP
jgi:anti-anti-sigma regulatory factor